MSTLTPQQLSKYSHHCELYSNELMIANQINNEIIEINNQIRSIMNRISTTTSNLTKLK